MLPVGRLNALSRLRPGRMRALKPGSEVGPEDASAESAESKVVQMPSRRTAFAMQGNVPLLPLLVVPSLAAGIYFFGIANDRFITRADFVIRKAEDPAVSSGNPGMAFLLTGGNQASIEDARYLKTYLQSPQVLAELGDRINLEQAFRRRGPDPFAGITPGLSREKKLAFFRKQVSVTLDEISGAIVLRTVALDPRSSHDLNRFMLVKSEQFVNRLNQDISLKQLAFAEQELNRSRSSLEQSKKRLLSYQNANRIIDPKGEADLTSQTIGKLQEKLVEMKVQLATLRRQYKDPNEPEVAAVADEIKELERQISVERNNAVSRSGKDLNRKTADVLRLESDVTYATDNYKLALGAVEKARLESKRQQKFMALLSAPQVPEDPTRDWRTKGFFSVLAGSIVALSLTKFVLGMQASHRQ